MTTINNREGKTSIYIQLPGAEAEHCANLKALTHAITGEDLTYDERKSLAGLLHSMLPSEHQLNLQ